MRRFFKYLKFSLIALIALYLILFSLSNKEAVKVELPLTDIIFQPNLFVFTIIIFIIGVVFGYLVTSAKRLHDLHDKHNLKKELKNLSEKLEAAEIDKKIDQQIRVEGEKNLKSFSNFQS